MDQQAEQIRTIMVTADKLLHEAARLRRDVARLHARIEPFENEPSIPEPAVEIRPTRNLKEAIDLIEAARREIDHCERDFRKIRSVIESIDVDALSREEMKPWLKPAAKNQS